MRSRPRSSVTEARMKSNSGATIIPIPIPTTNCGAINIIVAGVEPVGLRPCGAARTRPPAMITHATCSTVRPNFGTSSAPASVAPIAVPTANGASVTPAWMAEKCSPSCRNNVNTSRVPIIPPKNTMIVPRPAL